MQGKIVDSKYQILRRLGQGGMGTVYEARHLGTGRRVALKVIVPAALLNDDDAIPRFQREARASGAIDSQHVVQVLDTGVDPATNSPYLVMEHLTGEDLLQLVHRVGALAPDAVLRIVAQACSGLSRAHREGIVHRDIKSANLFVAQREGGEVVVKILDFGIAKVRADPLSSSAPQSITRTGSMLGSPLYMPPEQVIGTKDVDPRSDVFSLGITMYEALCGVTPNHECDTIGKLILAISAGDGPPVQQRAPWVPREVAAIVHKAVALAPNARYQTTAEMQAAIMAILAPQGASLYESMLVGASPAIRSIVALPLAQTPQESTPKQGIDPSAPTLAAVVAAPPNVAVLPLPAVASTGTAFVDSKPQSPRKAARWILAVALSLIVLEGAFVGISQLRNHEATPGPRPSASPVVSSSEPSPPASAAATSQGEPVVAIEPKVEPDAAVPSVADGGINIASASATARRAPPGASAAKKNPLPPAGKPPVNCDSKFYYENGVKHFKEECL